MNLDFLKELGLEEKNAGTWTGLKSSNSGSYIDSYSPVDGKYIGSVSETTKNMNMLLQLLRQHTKHGELFLHLSVEKSYVCTEKH